MNFKHLQIHVRENGGHYLGGWIVCESHHLEQAIIGESEIPFGKGMTRRKLENFLLKIVAEVAKTPETDFGGTHASEKTGKTQTEKKKTHVHLDN